MKKSKFFIFVSLILVIVMTFMSVTGCNTINFNPDDERDYYTDITPGDKTDQDKDDETSHKKPNNALMTYEWEDELENTETFVYGLIASDLETAYDVFSGYITLPNGTNIYGFGFTDYSDAYEVQAENKTFFTAGFVSFSDEATIRLEDIQGGLEIHRLDTYSDSNYGFLYSTTLENTKSHCVVFDKYLTYGVVDGVIQYSESNYERGKCDESLGALYSYDEERFLYDPDVGQYTPLTGTSVSDYIDYAAIEAEVNRIIREQEYNFSTSDVETAVYVAQEALEAYLLSLEQETFFGYNVQELIAISEQLDPMESIRITEDGLMVVDIEPTPPPQPSAFMKWMTGIVCGIAIVGSMALSVFVPALAPLSGAIIGSAVEVFSEIVVQNQTSIDIRKVCISALAGAISANTGIFGDAIIGGITNSVFTLMDGGGLEAAGASFLFGVGAGVVLGATFKLATKAIGAVVKKAAPKFVNNVGKFINDHQIDLGGKLAKQVDDITAPRSNYNAHKAAQNLIDVQSPTTNQIDDLAGISKYSDDILDGVKGDIPNQGKILDGKVSGNKFKGGHSPKIAESPDFKYSTKVINPDGTTSFSDVSYSIGGKTGTKNYHTLFPDSWSDAKITKAIDYVSKNCPLGLPDTNGNRLFCAYVDGVQIVVIKNSLGIVTAGYPSGGILSESLIKQFSIILK